MTLTVVCLWIKGKGKRAYGPHYVANLRSMVARHLSLPHRFVCLTDNIEGLPEGVEGIYVKKPRKQVPWWLKLRLFSSKYGWSGRLLYLDLDTLVIGSLDEIATFPAPFALLPDMAPNFKGNGSHEIVHRYNSSVMVLDAGARDEIWDRFDNAVTGRLRSDQDWIGEVRPEEATFPREWFARLHPDTAPPFAPETKVLLCIKLKNEKAAKTLPWFGEYWK